MTFSREARVGMFFVISMVLFGLMLEVGSRWDMFKRGISYKTYLPSSTGLKVGDSVKLAGVDVGTITAITVAGSRVQVDFDVKSGTRVKHDSEAGIRMSSMLGGQFLGLTFGTAGSPDLPPGSAVKSADSAGIDVVMDNVVSLTKDSRQLVQDLNKNQNEVMSKISVMLDENRSSVKQSLSGLASITSKIDRGDGSLGRLLNDGSLYKNVNELSSSLKDVSGKLERGEGTLGKLIKDDELYVSGRAAITHIEDISRRISMGEGTLGKLVNDPQLFNELRETVANLKEITRKINEGHGTIGKMVNDDKLYLDAVATLKKTEKAMEGLQDTGPISVIGSMVGTLF